MKQEFPGDCSTNMIIGLTGKSCSGKNYIGTLLNRKGFEVWDLDREAEKIRKEQSDKIYKLFNTNDKKKIANIVFADSNKLKQLEDIIYPVLTEKILNAKNDIVINGATLYRSALDKLCSFIIYVDAPFETRFERAYLRDHISKEDFQKREDSQNDVDYRIVNYRCPVFVVDNSKKDVTEDLDRILSGL